MVSIEKSRTEGYLPNVECSTQQEKVPKPKKNICPELFEGINKHSLLEIKNEEIWMELLLLVASSVSPTFPHTVQTQPRMQRPKTTLVAPRLGRAPRLARITPI